MTQVRKKIGIRFVDHKEWTGGVYYITNVVNALNFCSDADKPEITVFCSEADEKNVRANIHYPYLRFFFLDRKLTFRERLVNKLAALFSSKQVYSSFPPDDAVEFVFPNAEPYYFRNIRRIAWIPDFQEDHLPQFFTPGEIAARKRVQKTIADESEFLVLSSESARNDFNRIYPGSEARVTVLNFAVIHPGFHDIPAAPLLEKFNLPAVYFFSPNQFWTHKNHITVIRAVEQLKKKGREIFVAFSGKEMDYRDPDYTVNLKKYVSENGLEKNIRFLGFLDRKEQLRLMDLSTGIIQPSLFEGWSTVVEDAKAMSQVIIASDLDVHKEQLEQWEGTSAFFSRNDAAALAALLETAADGKLERKHVGYSANIRKYAADFINMTKTVAGK